jgi:hypothetical protein
MSWRRLEEEATMEERGESTDIIRIYNKFNNFRNVGIKVA